MTEVAAMAVMFCVGVWYGARIRAGALAAAARGCEGARNTT